MAADHLKVHLVMPGIDGGDDRLLAVLADNGCRIGGQRGQSDHRLVGGQRDAARGGKTDPQAGKAAGAGGHGDAVQRKESDAGLFHDPRDQRHQGFGVAALHRL